MTTLFRKRPRVCPPLPKSSAATARDRLKRRRLLAERLEDRRLLAVDYGDAPDAGEGVGAGDYQTRFADDGPAHVIVPGLTLGGRVDGDPRNQHGFGAKADDHSTLLADLARDYAAGVDQSNLLGGDQVSPLASGSGQWEYLVSERTDPNDADANLQSMVWDTGMNALEAPTSNHTDGSNGFYIGFPSGDELAFRPHIAAINRRPVARWIAGASDAGEVTLEGRVRKSATGPGDGIELFIYVDGVSVLEQAIAGEDGRGVAFTLPAITVAEGTTVDVLIDANSRSDLDATRVSLTIARDDDEDGVVGGTLEDLDLLPGQSPEVTLTATNETGDDAVLAGWIDYNRDGAFDNDSERATATVPSGSTDATVTLVFPEPPDDAVYTTYARFRLSTDAGFVVDPQPIGMVNSGEVEDYLIGRPTRVWDGEAGDHDVFNAVNWALETADGERINSNRVPISSDNVVIPSEVADQTLIIETTGSDRFRVRSIRSAAPLLIREKGLLQINRDSQIAALTLDGIRTAFGDSLQGSGAELLIDGDLTWNEAQINRVTIDVGGNLIIASDRPKQLISSSILANGDASIWSSGDIQASGSSIHNRGTFTTASTSDSLRPGPFSPSATFVNSAGATWIHDAPATGDEETDLFGRFYNHGALEVRQGNLAIGDCCTQLTHDGMFLVSPDAQLTLRSVATFAPESSVVAAPGSTVVIETSNHVVNGTFDIEGTLIVEGGVTFNTAVTAANLILDGGFIATTKPLTTTDQFQWLRGTLQGATLTSQGTMTIGAVDDAAGMTLRTRLINLGQATWLGRNVAFDGGVIQNDGSLEDASAGNMAISVFSNGTVENNGNWTIADTVGGGGRAQRDARFVNRGSFEIGQADVRVYQFAQDDGSLLLGGGNLEVSGGDLLINGGTVAGNGQLITDVRQNGGTISPGRSPGILNIDGDLVADGGQLLVEIAGPPIDENGQDSAGVFFDRLHVSGNADVAHLQVDVLGGYQPTLASRYLVLQANSLTGPTSDNAAEVLMTAVTSDTMMELVVTSEPNTPPIADAGGPYRNDEGADVTFDASATTDAEQAADSLTYQWDFDYDGVSFDTEATGRSVVRSFANQFGQRNVAVRVTDSGQLSALATTTLQIDNVPPEFVSSGTGIPAITIDANHVATLTGQFVDPGVADSHSLEIQWGDDEFERVDLAIGQRAFELTHTYADNQTGGPRDFAIQLAVYDEAESSDTTSLTLTQPFNNQPPVADAGGPYTALEGTPFTLDATGSVDPNQPADSLTYHWDLGYDGQTFEADFFGPQILVTIENNPDQPLNVAVRVSDTQGLFDIDSTTITVDNVPPGLRGLFGIPRLNVSIDETYVATLNGQFTDPGSDTQTVTIDWGDGTSPTQLSLSDTERQFTTTHPYPNPDESTNYVISVTVTDQDGGSDSGVTSLLVREPAATLRGAKFEDVNGDTVRDADESGLAGWTIELVDEATGQVVQSTVTAADGSYSFDEVPRGTYRIREVQQLGWHQTAPVDPVRRINVDAGGIESDGQSDSPAISADGRYIAFSSLASNLVPDDTNGLRDIFVKNTLTGAIERVSIPVGGVQADGPSYAPAISGDGNIIAFRSLAENLVQDDRNVASDIFVHDRRTGVTRRVSVNLDLDEGDEDSFAPSISSEGRYVAFESTASNLVPGDTNGVADIFVSDLLTGFTERISLASNGRQADLESYQPSISDDGRYVAFVSASQSFDDRDRDVDLDVYVFDRARNELTLASRDLSGTGGNGDSLHPVISGDGSTIAFASAASNLSPGDVNGHIDLFVTDRAGGPVRRITDGDGPSWRPKLSTDGSQVLFVSHASNLVTGDTNFGPDLFVHDRDLDLLRLVGQPAGEQTSHFTLDAVLNGDASAIAFASDGRDLVTGDQNARRDIFIQQLAGQHHVEVTEIEEITGLDFGNRFFLSSIQGQKFDDANGNGQRDVDPDSGDFTEPGLDGWTMRLVNQRTGETWQTVTASVDLDGDGTIDPMTESGVYKFGPLEPGQYDLYELTQSGWIPTLPAPLTPRPISQAPSDPGGRPPFAGPDPRLAQLPVPRVPAPEDPLVTRVHAVGPGEQEQLPVLYLHGMYEDGTSWGDYGEYFRTLADVTDNGPVVEGSAGVETYAIQFAADATREPYATSEEGVALLRSLDELRQQSSIPLISYIANIGEAELELANSLSLNPLETAANVNEAIGQLLGAVSDPAGNAVAECGIDVGICYLESVIGQLETANYNQHGLVEHRAVDLKDLIAEEVASGGSRFSDVSQVNLLTHGDGALDVRAMLALVQDSPDQAIRDAVANVIYAAPTFGGTVAAELDVAFFESNLITGFPTDPWVQSVLANNSGGEAEAKFYDGAFEAYLRTHTTAILDAVFDRNEYNSFEDQIANIPSPGEIEARVGTVITAIDNAFAAATGGLSLSDVDSLLQFGANSSTLLISAGIEVVVKSILSLITGSPGLPRGREDIRPYEAVNDNLNRYAANPDIAQFVVWGESVPPPENATDFSGYSNALAPILADAAADPRSLHAFGSRGRLGTTFLDMNIVPGDGVVSRTSALLLTDLAGGYMKALAGFDNHSHATLAANLLSESTSVAGSFLANDDDASASLGEVYVETLLTPVTSLEFSAEAIVQDAESRQFLVSGPATLSFDPEDRVFQDVFGRRLSVTATEVEYRIVSDPLAATPGIGSWRSADPATFSISFGELAAEAGAASEEKFGLEWRAVNQQGGREAIRSAVFSVDTSAPSLISTELVDGELPLQTDQIARPASGRMRALAGSQRLQPRLDSATLERLLNQRTPEYLVSLDRDKLVRLQFDSPVSVEYAWNDPTLSNARSTTLGDLDSGTAEFLIKERIPGQFQFGAGGIDFLLPGTHTLYYRSEDPGGNESAIQALTILVDTDSPLLTFNVDDGRFVGPTTPLSMSAADTGAGIATASISVPGVGDLAPGTVFALGETNLNETVESGAAISLAGTATDRVGNTRAESLNVLYDYLTPTVDVLSLSDSTLLFDGRFVTTSPQVELAVAFADDASGLETESLRWSVSHATTSLLASGTFQPAGVDRFEATITLNAGYNYVTLQATDLVGNSVSRVLTVIAADGYSPDLERGDRIDRDFGNARLPSIAGVKFQDTNGDGIRQNTEARLEGVVVYLDLNENETLDVDEPNVPTDERGFYQFENLLPRTYHVREVVPVGWQQIAPDDGFHAIDVHFGDVIEEVNFANQPPGTSLAGLVYEDLDGDGIRDVGEPGVQGAVIRRVAGQGGTGAVLTTSLSDGSFLFDGLDAGDYTVTYQGLSGLTLSNNRVRAVTLSEGESRNDIEFGVYQPITLSGLVFEDVNQDLTKQFFEQTLVDWKIDIDLFNDGIVDASESSTADGYEISGLPPGTHQIRAAASDGYDQTLPGNGGGYTLIVQSGAAESHLDFGFFDKTIKSDPTAVVSGIVFEDLNGDGLVDPGEPRLDDVRVFVEAAGTGEVLETTRSNADGQYSIVLLSGIDYRLRVDLAAGLTTSDDTFLAVNPLPGETITNLDFGIVVGTLVTGVVFEDANANGIFDSFEKPIEDSTVTLLRTSTGTQTTFQTDADGRYEFLLTGNERFHISSSPDPGFVVTAPAGNEYQILSEGNTLIADRDFGHFDGTRIAGQVFHDRNENGLRDANEEGVNAQVLQILDLITQQVVATVETTAIDLNGDGVIDAPSENGAFNVVLPRGPYDINLLPDSNWPPTTQTQQSVFLNEPVVTDLLFGVASLTLAGGTVYIDQNGNGTRDGDELGIEEVLVEAYDGRNQVVVSTTTDSSGAYELPIPADQNLTIVAALPGGSIWTMPARSGFYGVRAQEGQTITDLDFGRFDLVTLSGNVFNDQGGDGSPDGDSPIADWTVILDLDGDGDVDRTTVTDANGDYQFSNVGPGQHFVRQSRPEGWSRTAPAIGQFVIDAASGQTVDGLDFGNRFTLGTLAGQVFRDANRNNIFDEGDSGLNGWTVEIIDPSNQSVVATVVSESADLNEDGAISAEEVGRYSAIVPPGSYEIRQTLRADWAQQSPFQNEVIAEINTDTDWFPEDHPGRAANSVAFSRDGRYVAWAHSRGNSLPGIENRKPRFFLFDRITGTTEEIDLSGLPEFNDPETTFFGLGSTSPSLRLVSDELRISGDGRFVYVRAFLRPSMIGQVPSAYIYDRLEAKFEAIGAGVVGIDGHGDTLLSRTGLTDRASGVNRELWDSFSSETSAQSAALSWDGNHAAYIQFVSDPDDASRRQRQLFVYDDTTDQHHQLTDFPFADRGGEVVFGGVAIDDSGETIVATVGFPTKVNPSSSDYDFEAFIFDRTTGIKERFDPGGGRAVSITGDGRFVFYAGLRYDRLTRQATRAASGSISRDGELHLHSISGANGSFARFSRSDNQHLVDVEAGEIIEDANFVNRNFRPVIDPIPDVTFAEDTASPPIQLTGIFDAVGSDTTITLTGETSGLFSEFWLDLQFSIEPQVGNETSAVVTLTARPNRWDTEEVAIVATNAYGISTRHPFLVTVTPVNDAPVLNSALQYELPEVQAGQSSNGIRVADLLDNAFVSMAPPPIDDLDLGPRGIAVTDVDHSAGTWQFSTDDGNTWMDFPTGAQLAGTILLADDELSRIRLLSRADFGGTSDFTFRGWDQSIGSSGGAVSTPLANQTGGTSAFSIEQATASIQVLLAETDQDGVPDTIEDAAPNGGDGNDDGVPDRDQPNVASLPNSGDGTYVTIVAPEGTQLVGVEAIENPDPENSPATQAFPLGFISYEVHGVPVGDRVDIQLLFANNVRLASYYKYGPTPTNPEPHFYEFRRTSEYGIRRIRNGQITLRFTDGLTGDDDLTANGIIVDPGASSMILSGVARNPIDAADVNNDGQTTALDALQVINHLARVGEAEEASATSTQGDMVFLDVNGDTRVTPLDALHVINAIARRAQAVESEVGTGVVASPLDPRSVDAVVAESFALASNGSRFDDRFHFGSDRIDLESSGQLPASDSTLRSHSARPATTQRSIAPSQDHGSKLEKALDLLTSQDGIRIEIDND